MMVAVEINRYEDVADTKSSNAEVVSYSVYETVLVVLGMCNTVTRSSPYRRACRCSYRRIIKGILEIPQIPR